MAAIFVAHFEAYFSQSSYARSIRRCIEIAFVIWRSNIKLGSNSIVKITAVSSRQAGKEMILG
jgi:hypothetical protein